MPEIYYAVCVVADLPIEVVNTFLQTEYDEHDRDWKGNALHGERFLAVVTSLGAAPCTEPSIPPVADFTSPFIDKSPEECLRLVKQEAKRPDSELDSSCLVILDERTASDSTVLIVGTEDGQVATLRGQSGVAQGTLLHVSISHPPIGDAIYEAEKEEDKVLKR